MPLKMQHDEMPNLNLTSLIDVVFLLIVFFMAATKFTNPERDIDLRLPEVARGDALSMGDKARQVQIHADGRIQLDGDNVTLEELQSRLANAISGPRQSVVILGDAGCPFQHIAATMAACKQAGVTDLSVSVQVADAAGAAPKARR